MQRIVIIGLGRVGSSLGLALKRWIASADSSESRRAGIEVVGFDYDTDAQRAAEKLKAVDRTQWRLSRAVEDAALVAVTVPSTELRRVMQEVGPLLADGTVVTDTAPHKQQGLAWATEFLPKRVSYVAGHPVLATTGAEAPSVDLFVDRTYALFPHPAAAEDSTEVVVGLVQAIGAKPYFPDPAEHDAQVTATTLLPALAAVAMMHAVAQGPGWRDLSNMATSDLAQATRLASEDPDSLSQGMLLSPNDARRWLDDYIARLSELRDLVRRDDVEAAERIRQFVRDAHDAREKWLLRPTLAQKPAAREGVANHFHRLMLGGRRRSRE